MSGRTLLAVAVLAATGAAVWMYVDSRKARERKVDDVVGLGHAAVDEIGGILGGKPRAEGAERPKVPSFEDAADTVIGELNKISKQVEDEVQAAVPVSAEDETTWGKQVHEQFRGRMEIVADHPAVERMKKLAAPFLEECERGLGYTFLVVRSPEINAFSHLGGYVYFHTGLLDLGLSDDELRFVLGHEIAHIELGHTTRRLSTLIAAGKVGGGFAQSFAAAAYDLIAVGYSEDLEFEADAWASHVMREKLGASRQKRAAFLRRLEKEVDSKGPRRERPRGTVVGKIVKRVEDHYRTHPPTGERAERVEADQD